MFEAPLKKTNSNLCVRRPSQPSAGVSPGQPPPDWWQENTAYDCEAKRGTEEMHDCAIGGEPSKTPIPGDFYQTKQGDTLTSIVESAFAPLPVPDAESLALVINDDPCNVKFHALDISTPLGEDPWKIAIKPRFADSPELQSTSAGGGRGTSYPIIRIPPKQWRSKVSTYDGLSGFGVRDEAERGGGALQPSCNNLQVGGCGRNFEPLLSRAWDTASQWVERAYVDFPRAGTLPRLSREQADNLGRNFGLSAEDFAREPNRKVILEIRSKWAALNAVFKNRPINVKCVLDGDSGCNGTNGARAGGDGLSVCENLLTTERENKLPLKIVHEVAHLVNIGSEGFDVYQYEANDGYNSIYDYEKLSSAQQSVNQDSYAYYAAASGPVFTPGGVPDCVDKKGPSSTQE